MIWSLNSAVSTWPYPRFDHTERSFLSKPRQALSREKDGGRNLDLLNVLLFVFFVFFSPPRKHWFPPHGLKSLSRLSLKTTTRSGGSFALRWKALGRCSSCTIETKIFFLPPLPFLSTVTLVVLWSLKSVIFIPGCWIFFIFICSLWKACAHAFWASWLLTGPGRVGASFFWI